MKPKRPCSGQALIEYIFLFAFMTIIGINMVKGVTASMGKTAGGLSYVLTDALSSGVCEKHCYFGGYLNR